MSHQRRSGRVDIDTAFKAFGAIGILIGVVLTIGIIVLTVPFGGFVSTTPAVLGTIIFTILLVAVGYAAYSLRRRESPIE